MEYTGNLTVLLIGTILGGALIMIGLFYFAYWLIIKKAKNKNEETD